MDFSERITKNFKNLKSLISLTTETYYELK